MFIFSGLYVRRKRRFTFKGIQCVTSQKIGFFSNQSCENLESHMPVKCSLIDSNRKIAVYILVGTG
jgi:hypothetical protein